MRAIIFDCDGVLVDSEQWSCRAWLPLLAARGINAELADIEVFIGRSDQAVLDHFSQLSGQTLDATAIIPERERQYFDLAKGRLSSFAGLKTVLSTLSERQIPIAVASSGGPDKIRFSLAETGLSSFFDIICSATQVRHSKPAPDLFLLAANALGIQPQDCAVIEDSVPGIQGALAAQMGAVGFTSSHSASILQKAGAHHLFSSYKDLIPLLDSGFG